MVLTTTTKIFVGRFHNAQDQTMTGTLAKAINDYTTGSTGFNITTARYGKQVVVIVVKW